jgi:hypothetical protein
MEFSFFVTQKSLPDSNKKKYEQHGECAARMRMVESSVHKYTPIFTTTGAYSANI